MKIILIVSMIFASGCATISDFFGFEAPPPKEEVVVKEEAPKEQFTKYSDISNYAPTTDRQYKRMTKERMEEESELHAGAGSLWVMEGQTSYLFAQNRHRREGDMTNVKVEGASLKMLQTKVATIQDLLKELEIQKKEAEEKKRLQEAAQQKLADIESEKKSILAKNEADNEDAAQKLAEKRIAERKPASEAPKIAVKDQVKDEKIDLKELDKFPMKITEALQGGQYKVMGQQTINIRNKPYKIIATGVVRSDDFNDQSISSEKLYDAQFDVLHVKKAE